MDYPCFFPNIDTSRGDESTEQFCHPWTKRWRQLKYVFRFHPEPWGNDDEHIFRNVFTTSSMVEISPMAVDQAFRTIRDLEDQFSLGVVVVFLSVLKQGSLNGTHVGVIKQ